MVSIRTAPSAHERAANQALTSKGTSLRRVLNLQLHLLPPSLNVCAPGEWSRPASIWQRAGSSLHETVTVLEPGQSLFVDARARKSLCGMRLLTTVQYCRCKGRAAWFDLLALNLARRIYMTWACRSR
jgi:hypothetical protein